jgi:outer membrane protein TolC
MCDFCGICGWKRPKWDGKQCGGGRAAGGRRVLFLAIMLTVAPNVVLLQARAQTSEQHPGQVSAQETETNNPQNLQSSASVPSRTRLVQPTGADGTAPPITVTLQDALERARKNDARFLGAATDAKISREDRVQARNAMLPSASYTTQYLGTQGNGVTPNGRFVTNDGVHVYRTWGVFHQDLSPNTYTMTGYRRAEAAEAIAKAKTEIAKRGLDVTVTKLYYALTVSQRKYATAQQSLGQAQHFFEIAQSAEHLGQTAHSDVIKAEIQFRQQQQAFEESRLAMEDARLDLAVLLFPALNENFTVVDDLDSGAALPPFAEVQDMAEKENPELRVAMQTLRQANLEVTAAKAAFLPSMSVDVDYGIEANSFALRSRNAEQEKAGQLPNLGYFVTASFNLPVWDWGTLRSKLHQTKYKREQARAELSQAQRVMLSNLYGFYNEVSVARAAVETSRRTADLSAESLRLIGLRYQAGESSALELVDAQNTLVLARNAYDDAEARYRVALANLQTLTGNF